MHMLGLASAGREAEEMLHVSAWQLPEARRQWKVPRYLLSNARGYATVHVVQRRRFCKGPSVFLNRKGQVNPTAPSATSSNALHGSDCAHMWLTSPDRVAWSVQLSSAAIVRPAKAPVPRGARTSASQRERCAKDATDTEPQPRMRGMEGQMTVPSETAHTFE
jgi:hypothetical protein